LSAHTGAKFARRIFGDGDAYRRATLLMQDDAFNISSAQHFRAE
jgi:hypothetical protein